MSADYSITSKNLGGTALVSGLDVADLSYGPALNAPGACTFSLPIDQASATVANFSPGKNIVEVYRDGDIRWAGYLWSIQANTDNKTLKFACEGYLSRTKHWLIDDALNYTSLTEQFNIAWALLNFQNDAGFTRDGGESPSGVTRKRHYCCWERANVYGAICELADHDNGFDFEITTGKVWTVYYPRRQAITSKLFNAKTNCFDLNLTVDAGDISNEVSAIGQGEDCTKITVVSDSTSQSDYGLMQSVLDVPHAHTADDRTHKAAEELLIRKNPRQQITLKTYDLPFTGTTFDIGDQVKVTANVGWVQYTNTYFRVVGWQVDVSGPVEVTTVMLDSVLLP